MYKMRLDPLYISVNFRVYLLNRIIYCTCKYILLFSPLIFQPFTSRHSQQPNLKQLLYTRIFIFYKLFSPNHMKKILALAYWCLNRYNLQFWLSPILNLLTTIRVCEFSCIQHTCNWQNWGTDKSDRFLYSWLGSFVSLILILHEAIVWSLFTKKEKKEMRNCRCHD